MALRHQRRADGLASPLLLRLGLSFALPGVVAPCPSSAIPFSTASMNPLLSSSLVGVRPSQSSSGVGPLLFTRAPLSPARGGLQPPCPRQPPPWPGAPHDQAARAAGRRPPHPRRGRPRSARARV